MKKKIKIIADKTLPYLKGILEPVADITYLEAKDFTQANLKNAEILIIRSIDKCTADVLKNTSIKLITTATIGFDHIDTDFCEANGIIWKNAPGCNARSVAQYILSSIIYTSIQKETSLENKTLGIVGVGHVGKEVEKVCSAYGLNILLNDPPRADVEKNSNFVSLKTIAEESDIITFHTPLIKEGNYPTYHLADKYFFKSIKKSPWFINSARGSVNDTQALLEAKKQGIITELVIDCWEDEPHINRKLLSLATISSPHIAGFSADGKANATRACLEYIKVLYDFENLNLQNIQPPLLNNAIIDLDLWKQNRIENAILHTFNPMYIDSLLRENPECFESLRTNYNHPREFQAYHIINASKEEKKILKEIGFSGDL